MDLNSLLVCSDERALRVLRSVLSELEIHVEHCADYGSASKKLAQQRFEAVIIDCKEERSFRLLSGLRSGQHNAKSVAIAIIDAHTNLQTAFKLGANFVVYEPISAEKAKSSFRAARALMKRERRRSLRLQVNIAAYFRFQNGDGEHVSITGLSEGGISVRFSGAMSKKSGVIGFCFALPDTTTVIEATGTIAWQDSRRHAGIQFATLSESSKQSLKEWLLVQSEEKHDPPIRCSLTAISPAACFLKTQSPFPVHTRVQVLLRAADASVKTDGKVRMMDPELGMGIEFLTPPEQRERLEQLVLKMNASPESVIEVLVEPEGIDWEEDAAAALRGTSDSTRGEVEGDSLLQLIKVAATLSKELFLLGLKQHELGSSAGTEKEEENSAEPIANHRREPRLAVSLPVQMRGQDQEKSSPASLVDMSHRGARIDGVALNPKLGEVVHLVSNGRDARFLVIWVGEAGTPREGQIGLQELGSND
jgi:CheY-like chemotaxis protein